MYTVRRLLAGDAAGVVACVRRVYGDGYPRGELYSEEAIADLTRTGQWVCAVGLDAGGAVVAFLGLERSETGPIGELGMGMVLPEHRRATSGDRARAGLTERLRDFLLGEARGLGLSGQLVELGTVDTAAQVIAARAGITPCGLTLSLWPGTGARAAGEAESAGAGRLGFLRCFRFLVAPEGASLYVPLDRRGLVGRILGRMGRAVDFREGGIPGGAGRVICQRRAAWGVLFVVVHRIGADTRGRLTEVTAEFRRDRGLESVYVDLPLGEAGAAEVWSHLAGLGYFFGSVTPFAFGAGDGLRLQLLKRDPELARLRLVDPFAEELRALVRADMDRVDRPGPRADPPGRNMAVRTNDLHAIPLFQGITEQHLHALLGAFETLSLPAGEVLFEAGSESQYFYILTSGEVELRENDAARFTLTPIAPIGELGALTSLHRNTTAVATKPSEIYRISRAALLDFFERHGDVAFPFEHNLLQLVALKVRRDSRRIEEMRANLIRTQKAMKRLLDLVLEAPETPLSKEVAETLEGLIERNKRGHYLVEPTGALHSSVRLDGGAMVPVIEMSDGLVRFGKWPGNAPEKGAHFSGVLVTAQAEIAISGTVEASGDASVLVRLDLLIDDYQATLRDYLTRVQMLDFVV